MTVKKMKKKKTTHELAPGFIIINTKLSTKEYKRFSFHFLTNITFQLYEYQSTEDKNKIKLMLNKQRGSIQATCILKRLIKETTSSKELT